MIHEEICTYEVCKLAEEKGFPAKEIEHWYCEFDGHPTKEIIDNQQYPIISQSLLQRWLREEKGYYVYPYFDNVQLKWDWVCREKTGDKWIPLVGYDFHLFPTYELALEDALKYALKHLVL